MDFQHDNYLALTTHPDAKSSFSLTGKKAEVEIFRLGENDADYTSLKKLSSYAAFAGDPVSVAGLAPMMVTLSAAIAAQEAATSAAKAIALKSAECIPG